MVTGRIYTGLEWAGKNNGGPGEGAAEEVVTVFDQKNSIRPNAGANELLSSVASMSSLPVA